MLPVLLGEISVVIDSVSLVMLVFLLFFTRLNHLFLCLGTSSALDFELGADGTRNRDGSSNTMVTSRVLSGQRQGPSRMAVAALF